MPLALLPQGRACFAKRHWDEFLKLLVHRFEQRAELELRHGGLEPFRWPSAERGDSLETKAAGGGLGRRQKEDQWLRWWNCATWFGRKNNIFWLKIFGHESSVLPLIHAAISMSWLAEPTFSGLVGFIPHKANKNLQCLRAQLKPGKM